MLITPLQHRKTADILPTLFQGYPADLECRVTSIVLIIKKIGKSGKTSKDGANLFKSLFTQVQKLPAKKWFYAVKLLKC